MTRALAKEMRITIIEAIHEIGPQTDKHYERHIPKRPVLAPRRNRDGMAGEHRGRISRGGSLNPTGVRYRKFDGLCGSLDLLPILARHADPDALC